MYAMKRSVLSFIAVLTLVSCASAKTISAEELHSDLLSALSLASETGLFIAQIENGHLLPQFRAGHADYLRHEAGRQAKQLRESRTDSGDAKTPAQGAEQLELLARVLTSIRAQTRDEKLVEARQGVAAIRRTLSASGAGR